MIVDENSSIDEQLLTTHIVLDLSSIKQTSKVGVAFSILEKFVLTNLTEGNGLAALAIIQEMKKDESDISNFDYEHMINTFNKYFGHYVIIKK
jgi:hypothetical protein